MALTDEGNGIGNMVMPVAPMYGNGGNGGFGDFGNGWWFILLILLFGNGMWGNNNGFGGGACNPAGIYPWMNQAQITNDGFEHAATRDYLTGIQNAVTNGFGDVQTSLCNGFAGVNAGIANGFAQAEIANNGRQMANMQQAFAAQTAMNQGFNGLQSQLASCCCDNRLASAEARYTTATEACATRTANAENTRDIIDAQTRGTQAILDKLCALELDGVKGQLAAAQRENLGLQNQLNMASFRESQANQNALFAQGMNAEVDALYNRLKNCPVPSQPVYGNQPIFTCGSNNFGCGCGCGGVA